MSMYKQPRRINLVSTFLTLLVVAGIYAGWKFIPVYYQAWKVDDVLEEVRFQAADVRGGAISYGAQREMADKIQAAVLAKVRELGIVDQPDFPIEVAFTDGFAQLYVRYRVVVRHLLVKKTTTLEFKRTLDIPAGKGI
jgi:hypothetical protein